MTVYMVRTAIISAGRRHATPVIDKRLHLHIVSISANTLKQSIFTCPAWLGLVKTTCCLIGPFPFNHHRARCEKTERADGECGAI